MEIYEKILSEVKDRSLLTSGDKVIASVSGGPDSTFLLEFLAWAKKKLGIEIHVFHLDHMLRGHDSRDDLKFTQILAERHGLPFTSVRRDIQKLKLKRKGSLQDVARDVRKDELQKLMIKTGATKIATAHHLDDRIETFFQRLLRGAGKKGLASISYSDGSYIRPLLSMTKDEILECLMEKKVAFRTDNSNDDIKYFRNKIRLKLVPSIREISPKYQHTVKRFMDIQESEDSNETEFAKNILRVLENSAARSIDRSDPADNIIGLTKCLRLDDLISLDSGFMALIIRELIKTLHPQLKGIEKRHTDLIIKAIIGGKAGCKVELPGQTYIAISGGMLIAGKKMPAKGQLLSSVLKVPGVTRLRAGQSETQKPIDSGLRISSSIIEGDKLERLKSSGVYRKAKDNETAYLDLSKCGSDLVVTKRSPGDRMKPFGLDGQKKVQDILVDHKIPKDERDLVPIVRSGDKVAWVAGVCISDDMRITPRTARVLKLQIHRNNGPKQ